MKTYALEMMLATLMVTCGLTLVWQGDTFAMAHYGMMRHYIDERPGGGFLMLIGIVRWYAIIRNGGSGYRPLLRIGGCCIGCGFWLTLAITVEATLLLATKTLTGPPLLLAVAGTAAIFEIYAATKGAADANREDSLGLRAARSKVGRNGSC